MNRVAESFRRIARFVQIAAAGIVAILSAASADEGWSAQVTPYGWLVGVEGAALQEGAIEPTDIDIGAFDLLGGVRFGAMGSAEVRRGRWGVIADAAYGKFLIDAAKANVTLAGEDLDIAVVMGNGLVAFRALDHADIAVDIIAGARLFAPRVKSIVPAGSGSLVFDITDRLYADPVVGLRSDIPLSRSARLHLYGDIGGAGVSSDLTWQTYGGVSLDVVKRVSVSAGYRMVAWRFPDTPDEPLRKLKGSGPLLAVSVGF